MCSLSGLPCSPGPRIDSAIIGLLRANPDCRDLDGRAAVRFGGRCSNPSSVPNGVVAQWGVWAVDQRGKDANGEAISNLATGYGAVFMPQGSMGWFPSPIFRGFGGCESYVMEKFRQRGDQVLCCPWLRWTHRFQSTPWRTLFDFSGGNAPKLSDRIPETPRLTRPRPRNILPSSPARRFFRRTVNRLLHLASPIIGNSRYGGVAMRGRLWWSISVVQAYSAIKYPSDFPSRHDDRHETVWSLGKARAARNATD